MFNILFLIPFIYLMYSMGKILTGWQKNSIQLFLILVSFSSNCFAQENLILNPGFEEDTLSHPINRPGRKEVNEMLTVNWIQPTNGTSDFWNSDECKVKKILGYGVSEFTPHKAHSGKGRVGAIFYSPIGYANERDLKKTSKRFIDLVNDLAEQEHMTIDTSNRIWLMGEAMKVLYEEKKDEGFHEGEYIQSELKCKLEAGKSYYCEYYILLDKSSGMSVSNSGIYFSENPLSDSTNALFDVVPQVLCTDSSVLISTSEWKKISGCYLAKGGEKFITVGTFGYNGYCPAATTNNGKTGFRAYTSYYYMDDFLLVEDSADLRCKNEWPEDRITMVIDISNSMYKKKHIDQLKKGVSDFISKEGSNSKISVITFGSGINIYSRAQKFKDSTQWNELIDTFNPAGGTNIGRAITCGFYLADSLKNPGSGNRVVLFTDAQFDLDKETIKTVVHGIENRDIEFSLFQFGEFQNKELDNLIQKSGGKYVYSSETDLREILLSGYQPFCLGSEGKEKK